MYLFTVATETQNEEPVILRKIFQRKEPVKKLFIRIYEKITGKKIAGYNQDFQFLTLQPLMDCSSSVYVDRFWFSLENIDSLVVENDEISEEELEDDILPEFEFTRDNLKKIDEDIKDLFKRQNLPAEDSNPS